MTETSIEVNTAKTGDMGDARGWTGAQALATGAPMHDAVDGVIAAAVTRPSDVAAVQDAIRSIGERRGASLIASGLGAHLDMGAPPERVDLLLRMDGLDRVVDHQAADMTVTVEPGCPLARLEKTLAAAGQWLPLDPPSFERTTVGGLVAANLSGPLRASQGTVRDLLLGIRVVDAGGALVAGGGKVVKNVAGYDLPKLHVGALGTLGVIVEATFKVRPRPEREEGGVLVVASLTEAAGVALELRDAFDPLWLEAGTLEDGIGVAVGVGGIGPEVAAARRTIEDVARRRGATLRWCDDGAAVRRALSDFPVVPSAATIRASVLPDEVGATMTRIRELAGDVPVLAHASNGVVRARIEDASAVGSLVETLRREIARRGGFVVVERARPEVKRGLDVWGDPGEGLALMRGVKAAFDPHGLFAPGRYVGGI
jgi:glycolate oxidase FAD binding subunit